MGLKRKVRQIGNSVAYAVPNEIFDFLNLNPQNIKYKLTQDDTGAVFIIILNSDVIVLDEKKFQKQGSSFAIIIPKALCAMWNIGVKEGEKRELEISFENSPLKWRLEPN